MSRVTVIVDDCGHRVCTEPELRGAIRFGAPRSTTAEQRAVKGQRGRNHPGKAQAIMDLLADKELPINGFAYTDEVGNPVDEPAGAVEEFTSSDETLIVITMADDGQMVARATGTLGGPVNVHGVSTWTDEAGDHTITADAALNVVAGLAERGTVAFGEAREVTPDV